MTQSDEGASSSPLGLSIEAAQQVGRRLSEAREKRNVSVSELARKVKIREHFAYAIERGDFASLPPGLNGRGLVRLYARELGVVIPELEPSAHLSESNARVERAEQALTDEVLRGQTIRSYPAGSVLPQFPHMRGDFARESFERKPPSFALGARRPREAPISQGVSQSGFAKPNTRDQESQSPQGIRGVGPFLHDSVEDEAPLDVVTPDIASVLGLDLGSSESSTYAIDELSRSTSLNIQQQRESQSTMRQAEVYSPGSRPQAPIQEVPDVSVHDLIGTEPTLRSDKTSRPTNDHQEEQVISFEALVQNEEAGKGRQTFANELKASRELAPSVGSLTPETVPLESLHTPESAHSLSQTVGDREAGHAPEQVTQPIPFGHAEDAAYSYVHQLAHTTPEGVARGESLALTDETYDPVDPRQQMAKNQSEGMQSESVFPSRAKRTRKKYVKYFFGLVVAGGIALLIFVLLPSTRPQNTKRIVEVGRVEDQPKQELLSDLEAAQRKTVTHQPEAIVRPESSAQLGAEPQSPQSPLPQSAAMTASPIAPEHNTSAAVAGGGESSVAGSASQSSTTASPGSTTASPGSTTASPGSTTASPGSTTASPGSTTYGQGATSAELFLDGMVDLQVRTDGSQVVNGMQAAGKIILRFDKSCEIIASDGSLVRLNYAGWEHGALGHKGRRRRLILNSGGYTEARSANASTKPPPPAASPTP